MVSVNHDLNPASVDFADFASAIVLFPVSGNLDLLDQTLFSLSISSATFVQVVIAIQGGTTSVVGKAADLLLRQPFLDAPGNELEVKGYQIADELIIEQVGGHYVVSIDAPSNTKGILMLIDEGARWAQGRYLSFHTHHDALYHNALDSLIRRAQSTNAGVVVGRTRSALVRRQEQRLPIYITHKSPLRSTRAGSVAVLLDSASPFNSCLIDRHKIKPRLRFTPCLSSMSGCHSWLTTLAGQCRLNLCGTSVAEVRRWPSGTDLLDDIEKDWYENMESVKASFLLNSLLGPRGAGNPLFHRVAKSLMRALLAVSGGRSMRSETAARSAGSRVIEGPRHGEGL